MSFRAFPERHEGLGAGSAGNVRRGITMPLYEHVYLARQDLSQQQVDELTAQYKGVIEQLGGKVAKAEYWGVKTLTYRIRKNRKAHFTLLNIDGPSAAITEVERQQHINEDVLRAMTVSVDELEEGPSAMMRKVDRDRDRDERRGERRRDRDGRDGRGPRGDDDTETSEE
jgi:small subunit ribosomal protein S6